MENYHLLIDELAQEDLDKLAHARSCSVSSIAVTHLGSQSVANTPTQSIYNNISSDVSGRHSRASSSSSSGCMSDGAPSSCENAFDSEFPMGKNHKKQSMRFYTRITTTTSFSRYH